MPYSIRVPAIMLAMLLVTIAIVPDTLSANATPQATLSVVD